MMSVMNSKVCLMLGIVLLGQGVSGQVWAKAAQVTRLMQAARQGEVAVVVELLKTVPIDSRDELARTAVHYAVEHRQAEVLDVLIDAGADPNLIDANGDTPYDLWWEYNDLGINRILQRGRAKKASLIQQQHLRQDRAAYTKKNAAMLFEAAATGKREMVEQLLEVGTDPTIKNAEGLFPFHIAEQNRQPAIAAILLRKMRGVNGSDNRSWTPMQWAVLARDWEMLRDLLRSKANFRYKIPTMSRTYQDPYDVAVMVGAEDKFLTIIFDEQRMDIVRVIAEKAIRAENEPLFNLLVKHGLDLASDEEASIILLMQAVRTNKREMIAMLMQHGLHEDSLKGVLTNKSAIDNELTLTTLLRYITDPDEINQGLNFAYTVNRYDRILSTTILFERGADPNTVNEQGDTPIITAIKSLSKPKISWAGWRGSLQEYLQDIAELVKQGADINATDASGKTPLILLAKEISKSNLHNYLELVELLLANGADKSITDNANLTAKDYASRKNTPNTKLLELLE